MVEYLFRTKDLPFFTNFSYKTSQETQSKLKKSSLEVILCMKEFDDKQLLGHRRMPEILGTQTDEILLWGAMDLPLIWNYSTGVISSGFPLFPLEENQIILLRKSWTLSTVQNFFNVFSVVRLLFYVSQTDTNQTWMHNSQLQGLRFVFFKHWSGLNLAMYHWLRWIESIC